jgi:hypothetical protein
MSEEKKKCSNCGVVFERTNDVSEKSWHKIKYCGEKCRELVSGQNLNSQIMERKRKYAESWYTKNSELLREKRRKRYLKTKDAEAKNRKKYYAKNKETILSYCKTWSLKNKERKKEVSKKWRDLNPEKVRKYYSDYAKRNKQKINEKNKKIRSTPIGKLKTSLRNSSKRIAYYSGAKKRFPTVKFLGCSFACAKQHIESQFKDGMSWDNFGEWHIDHIRPLASFDLTDVTQQLMAGHYTNLQPLWAAENMAKGAKYEEPTEEEDQKAA